MLSDETWNALSRNGREQYAPLMGRTYRHIPTGFEGVAVNYTLCGQLWLRNENGYGTFWADECEEVRP